MGLSYKEVEARVSALANRSSYDREFIFDLLLAYGRSPSNVSRLRPGAASSLNAASDPATEVAQKNVLYLKEVPRGSEDELIAAIEKFSVDPVVVRLSARFVIVTDYRLMLAKDTKTGETLIAEIGKIPDHFIFFLPWAGMEKTQYAAESHADVRAAERMAKLFDELVKQNPETQETLQGRHSLNTFFTRILFCFFAEDTGIFQEGQFTTAIESLTQSDGTDVKGFLEDLFAALDTEDGAGKPQYLAGFPYVNGRLFAAKSHLAVPGFNKKARDILVETGRLQWSQINPDIFGSMFQAVVKPDQRANLGQHYTSVPNILKTIEPLFLDPLKDEFDAGYDKEKKLEALLERIGQIRIFDPACGSGNFLVIAYKELRKLEHAILERLTEISPKHQLLYAESRVNIENFSGIELDDFAAEVAILALWIAKHQMNQEFKEKFRIDLPLIPLTESGNVKQGNAAHIDWQSVCLNDGDSEIYVIGNPPYKGGKSQSKELKADYPPVFGTRAYSKDLDYVALWFVKGADYIRGTKAQLSFVATNSVSQGEHVGLLFPMLFGMGLEIGYAYTSFKWENNARKNAAVIVVVVSLRNVQRSPKFIFTDGVRSEVSNINGYLADAPNDSVFRRTSAISAQLPRMVLGSMPKDGGHLILSQEEKARMLHQDPSTERFIRRYVGASNFINGEERYCLWIEDQDLEIAENFPGIANRLAAVSEFRLRSSAASTAAWARRPHRFVQDSYEEGNAIIVPQVSSERREYVPIGYLPPGTVINNSANAIYRAEPWVFGLLTSRMHMVWLGAVGGRLKGDFRYGTFIVYNNFPLPNLSPAIREELGSLGLKVLDAREVHSERTLRDLYDPEKMPNNLTLAHKALDDFVDSVYSSRGFGGTEERLTTLFKMYSSAIAKEKEL